MVNNKSGRFTEGSGPDGHVVGLLKAAKEPIRFWTFNALFLLGGTLGPVLVVRQIMDNLPAHKSVWITKTVEYAGRALVSLPPYSPDLKPIENMWSKVKAILRKAAACTFEALVDGVDEALRAITLEDCDGYFEHCGYGDTSR